MNNQLKTKKFTNLLLIPVLVLSIICGVISIRPVNVSACDMMEVALYHPTLYLREDGWYYAESNSDSKKITDEEVSALLSLPKDSNRISRLQIEIAPTEAQCALFSSYTFGCICFGGSEAYETTFSASACAFYVNAPQAVIHFTNTFEPGANDSNPYGEVQNGKHFEYSGYGLSTVRIRNGYCYDYFLKDYVRNSSTANITFHADIDLLQVFEDSDGHFNGNLQTDANIRNLKCYTDLEYFQILDHPVVFDGFPGVQNWYENITGKIFDNGVIVADEQYAVAIPELGRDAFTVSMYYDSSYGSHIEIEPIGDYSQYFDHHCAFPFGYIDLGDITREEFDALIQEANPEIIYSDGKLIYEASPAQSVTEAQTELETSAEVQTESETSTEASDIIIVDSASTDLTTAEETNVSRDTVDSHSPLLPWWLWVIIGTVAIGLIVTGVVITMRKKKSTRQS